MTDLIAISTASGFAPSSLSATVKCVTARRSALIDPALLTAAFSTAMYSSSHSSSGAIRRGDCTPLLLGITLISLGLRKASPEAPCCRHREYRQLSAAGVRI